MENKLKLIEELAKQLVIEFKKSNVTMQRSTDLLIANIQILNDITEKLDTYGK